jgi:hypothetical protein
MQGSRPLLSFHDNMPFKQLIACEQRAVIRHSQTSAPRRRTQHVIYSSARCCNRRDDSRQVVFLHTMRNEHFGISLVEAMAAGNDV